MKFTKVSAPPPKPANPEDADAAQIMAWCDAHPGEWWMFEYEHPLILSKLNQSLYDSTYRRVDVAAIGRRARYQCYARRKAEQS
jgi:hypothetical protein